MKLQKPVRGVEPRELERFAQRAQRSANLPGEVNILVTESRAIRALNRRFRGVDRVTDVLSFPPPATSIPSFAGDIVISATMAAENADRYGHTVSDELKILILHGMLHLAGLDHERDRGEMARKEERLRRRLGLRDGLIRRTTAGRRRS